MVSEWSTVGESASNGRAERTVQQVEDLLSTHLHALESRIKASIPSNTPAVRWLVEHTMNMINMYTVNPDGVTPYAALHGKRAVGTRTKLCLRWRLGTFLGVPACSNEVYIAIPSGQIIKTRSIPRAVADNRCDSAAVLGVTGTPGDHTAVRVENAEHGHLEEREQPHVDAD